MHDVDFAGFESITAFGTAYGRVDHDRLNFFFHFRNLQHREFYLKITPALINIHYFAGKNRIGIVKIFLRRLRGAGTGFNVWAKNKQPKNHNIQTNSKFKITNPKMLVLLVIGILELFVYCDL